MNNPFSTTGYDVAEIRVNNYFRWAIVQKRTGVFVGWADNKSAAQRAVRDFLR